MDDNNVFITVYTTDEEYYRFESIKQFVFKKDKYTPYTELSVTIIDNENILSHNNIIANIRFVLGHNILHVGIIDNVDHFTENGISFITIRSRGYTSLLLNNQMVPGIHADMSLKKLMTSYYQFPNTIMWENDSSICNYIYVKEHRSMWDSIVNLGYKLYKTYPYIKEANKIMLRPHNNTSSVIFEKNKVLKYGTAMNTTGILSHLHMQDIEGNYETYNLENPLAEKLLIVRHKQIPFDKQYLNDPNMSMKLTFALASKAWRSKYITINGRSYLDINDIVGMDDFLQAQRVSAITISGNAKGIKSTYYVYEDDFKTTDVTSNQ